MNTAHFYIKLIVSFSGQFLPYLFNENQQSVYYFYKITKLQFIFHICYILETGMYKKHYL